NEEDKCLCKLLRIIKKVIIHTHIYEYMKIKERMAIQLSWTGDIRISNEGVIKAISESIKRIEKSKNDTRRSFIREFFNSLNSISSFNDFWENPGNIFFKIRIETMIYRYVKEKIETYLYEEFAKYLLSI